MNSVYLAGGDAERLGGFAEGGSLPITGTEENDFIEGTAADEVLSGEGGHDLILDQAGGNDQLFGGAGNDTLLVGRHFPGFFNTILLDGGDGNDHLLFFGYSVDDPGDRSVSHHGVDIRGGEGADTIYVTDANEAAIDAGAGDDDVEIDLFGPYSITLGAGRDLLTIGDPRGFIFFDRGVTVLDFVTGAAGDRLDLIDYLRGILFDWDVDSNPFATGHLRLVQQGADTLLQVNRYGDGDFFKTILTFKNRKVADFTPDNLSGYSSDGSPVPGQTITGTDGPELLFGLSGDDIVYGLAGDDIIRGLAGDDELHGGEGRDTLVGEYGDDELFGEGGDDTLFDRHSGNDILRGGDGRDTLYVERPSSFYSTILLDGGADNDNLSYIGNGAAFVFGTFLGGDGDDSIFLNGQQDSDIDGGPGADEVFIYLNGGIFDITLGSGSDLLVLGFYGSASGIARINVLDFDVGADRFELDTYFHSYFVGWDGEADLFDAGFLRLVQYGIYAVLESDRDGGGDEFEQMAVFKDVQISQFNAANFFVQRPIIAMEITGTEGDDLLSGADGRDRLYGLGGNDHLFGEANVDTTDGGPGNDTHYVDKAGDIVVERAGEGHDVVHASASYRLAPGAHVEVLVARFPSSTDPIDLAGNEFVNAIYGSAGPNVLDGGGGADVMFGFAGDDFYYTDHVGDLVIEASGEGHDVVYADADFVLTAGSHVEVLLARFQSSTAPINLTGNELNNAIYGSVGANSLTGGGGVDVMFGFAGDDFYFTDNAGDLAIEAAGEGHDVVFATADFTLTGGSHVEVLLAQFQSSSAPINLTGNELNNVIYGSVGANSLDGRAGADIMFGFAGDDSYYVDNLGDVAVEAAGEGHDVIYASSSYTLTAGSHIEVLLAQFQSSAAPSRLIGNELGNAIYGSAGANTIGGRGGVDVLFGFGGADRFLFDTAPGTGNHDYIADFQAGVDLIVFDNAAFSALADGALPSSAFHAGTAAADADDRIIYDRQSGALFYDADGSGSGAALLVAYVQPNQPLAASDFAVI